MKNSQEYTAQDPLVNAAYNLLKSIKEEANELKEMTKAKLDKTNRISSDEYSKLRKKSFFNPKEWKWNDDDMLYHRIVEEVQTEQVKTIKVGEDAVGTDAELHYAVVSDRKVQAVGEKEEMLDYCKENGGRVWKTAKQVGDLVEEKN